MLANPAEEESAAPKRARPLSSPVVPDFENRSEHRPLNSYSSAFLSQRLLSPAISCSSSASSICFPLPIHLLFPISAPRTRKHLDPHPPSGAPEGGGTAPSEPALPPLQPLRPRGAPGGGEEEEGESAGVPAPRAHTDRYTHTHAHTHTHVHAHRNRDRQTHTHTQKHTDTDTH